MVKGRKGGVKGRAWREGERDGSRGKDEWREDKRVRAQREKRGTDNGREEEERKRNHKGRKERGN